MTHEDGGRADDDPGGVPVRRRVVEQFSDAGERAAIWRGFGRFLPTREYLNLGYSPRGWPTLVGDSQVRLARLLADGLADRLPSPAGERLVDVGCGRGGPARQFAARGFAVTGVDLVRNNVALARAATDGTDPAFLVGDAAALPLADEAFAAAAAVDALVYVPDERAAFREVARVLEPDGWFAVADLLASPDAPPAAEGTLAAFADAWDMAPPTAADVYRDRLRSAGFAVESSVDVTPNSTGRFRKWSAAFLAAADGPAGGALARLLRRWDVDPAVAVRQVRAAHRALPYLRHEVLFARRR